ncbi:uncharacterized protein [Miscanthus floridulus]|uniref:uncharacterized protein n=1 Tax=Miscanthus floridulus TaxID=154761 RepID=UPI0034588205
MASQASLAVRLLRATLPVKAALSIDPSATVAVRASSRSATGASTPVGAASLPNNSRSASALSSAETELLMLPRRASTSVAAARAASDVAAASASALAAASLDALAAAAAVSAAAGSHRVP